MLKTEAESILRTSDKAIVAPEGERSRRGISCGEIVRAEAPPSGGSEQVATAERFGRQTNERFEHGEDLVPNRRSGADERVLSLAGKAPSH
jgi:hypothetical protein